MCRLISPTNVLGSYHLSMSDTFWDELHEGVQIVKEKIKLKYKDYLTDESIIKINVLVSNAEFDNNNSVKKISFQVGIEEQGIESPFVVWAIKRKVHHLDFVKELLS